MSILIIEPSASTPSVKFDVSQNHFEISGRSMPENSLKFYSEVLNWLKEHIEGLDQVMQLRVNLEYYNTGTYVRLMEIFNVLSELHTQGREVSVVWFYDNEDEEHLEDGKAYAEVVTVPFLFEELNG